MKSKNGYSIWRRHAKAVMCAADLFCGLHFLAAGLLAQEQFSKRGCIVLGIVFVLISPLMWFDRRPENHGPLSVAISCIFYFVVCAVLCIRVTPLWLCVCAAEILILYLALRGCEARKKHKH